MLTELLCYYFFDELCKNSGALPNFTLDLYVNENSVSLIDERCDLCFNFSTLRH